MKYIFILFLLINFMYAERVEITADKFEADEKKRISSFIGNVTILKGKDQIHASKLIINFDKKNKPIKYEATGNINFKLSMKDQKYEGKADKVIYEPAKQKYTILGNAFLHEKVNDRKLYGDKIMIDRLNGKSDIIGKKDKPVKIIFSVEEK